MTKQPNFSVYLNIPLGAFIHYGRMLYRDVQHFLDDYHAADGQKQQLTQQILYEQS